HGTSTWGSPADRMRGNGDCPRHVVVAATHPRTACERWGFRMAGTVPSSGGQDGGITPVPTANDPGWAHTVTTGATPGGGGAGGPPHAGAAQQVVGYGPGVPVGAPAGQAAPPAEQVWQAGAPAAPRGRRRRLIASSAVSIALLIASGVVIFLRL